MSNANTLFGDDWQPADWLQALDRLAPAPAPEPIPVSSKIVDVVTDERLELKPCPFCGGKPELYEESINDHWYVICTNCRASSCSWNSSKPPVREWNKRHIWSWPTPRTFANQIPDDQQVILVWHDQSWKPAYMSHSLKQYFLLGYPYEEWHSLSVDGVWLPMPPAIEVQA